MFAACTLTNFGHSTDYSDLRPKAIVLTVLYLGMSYFFLGDIVADDII
jgi:hypothetical protein